MNAAGEAISTTLQPMVGRITAVINSFTKWIEANRGLVTSIAATVAGVTAFGAGLFTIGTAARVLSGGMGVVTGAVSGVFGAPVQSDTKHITRTPPLGSPRRSPPEHANE